MCRAEYDSSVGVFPLKGTGLGAEAELRYEVQVVAAQ
jgi:hypothetical protein